jgi:hypothetical protein
MFFIPAPSFADEMGMIGSGGDAGGTLVIPSQASGVLVQGTLRLAAVQFHLGIRTGSAPWLHVPRFVTIDHSTDVERNQLPNCLALWFERTDESPPVHPRLGILRCFGCLVLPLPVQASVWVLSLPWFFFGVAFLLIGLPYVRRA